MVGGPQSTESFVTRIWLERVSEGEQVWRGHIRHIQSRKESYFEQMDEALDFMERVTGVPCRQLRESRHDKKTAS
jgi:hypothetical protein